MHNLALEPLTSGKFRSSIKILSTHDLLCRLFAAVCRKIANSYLAYISNPEMTPTGMESREWRRRWNWRVVDLLCTGADGALAGATTVCRTPVSSSHSVARTSAVSAAVPSGSPRSSASARRLPCSANVSRPPERDSRPLGSKGQGRMIEHRS